MEEKKEEKTLLDKIFEKAREIGVRELDSFSIQFDSNLNIVIDSVSGWSMTYPMGTEVWALLANWIEVWDESSKMTVENFIKVIVFPTSVRLSDIDLEYIADIIAAHEKLTDRNLKAAPKQETEGEEHGDLSLGEAIRNVFGDDEEDGDSN